jgi:two-component system response regulator FixJ
MSSELGADAVLFKPIDTARLLVAMINAIHAKPRSVSTRRKRHATGAQLTPRQQEIFRLLGEGASNKDIGQVLGISARTVDVHRAEIMARLGLTNAVELGRMYAQLQQP